MNNNNNNLQNLIDIINTLRSPGGCQWDREQTHTSLKQNFIEETYEALDAIDEDDMKSLQEELGDVLLQVVLHSQIAKEEGHFNIEDVAKGISEKLIRRHPHVFGDTKVTSTKDILENWEIIKKKEKPERKSVLDGISFSLPALMCAYKLSKKAVKSGFEWPSLGSLYQCIESEFEEFKSAVAKNDKENQEEEIGDILFAIVNLARWHKINPELALAKANKKFAKRFRQMESLADKPLNDYSFEEFDSLWNNAKESLKTK